MSTKLSQVMALAPQRNVSNGFELDPLPELGGKYLSIAPVDTKRFNDGLREWRRKTEVRISEQIVQRTES
jgi:hypothetical protein